MSAETPDLPAPLSASGPRRGAEPSQDSDGHGQLVLLVEEGERQNGSPLEELLRSLGHRTVRAVNGASGLVQYTRARDRGEPFDLLMVDASLPGRMGGREIVDALRTLAPRAPVVLAARQDAPDLPRAGNWTLLSSPWTAERLEEAVQKALALR